MHTVQFEISKPTDEAAFEDMCARIYGEVYGDPLPQTNGRRGQSQGGIDVFIDAPEGRIGIQCKKYNDGALKFKHIQHEVALVDKATTAIVRLIIATTATSDVGLIRDTQNLSDKRVAAGLFPVTIEFWQDICRHIRGSPILQNDYAPNAPGALFHRVDSRIELMPELHANVLSLHAKFDAVTGLPDENLSSVNRYVSSQLDAINSLLVAARFRDGLDAVERIGSDMSLFDIHQKARWHVQRGVCTLHLDCGEAAAPDFLKAAELYRGDEKIEAAKIRGLLYLGRIDEAIEAGQLAVERFPASVHVWIVYANARLIRGDIVELADAPVAMRENCDVLQLAAWAKKEAGNLTEAVRLSSLALSRPDAGFFVRRTALVLALEAAVCDPVLVAYGLVAKDALTALKKATEALSPRKTQIWSVQASDAIQETLVHLGYAYLALGDPNEALTLVEEARREDVLTPRLKRVWLEALRELDRIDDLLRLGQEWLFELEEEALLITAEHAASMGNLQLVDAIISTGECNFFKRDDTQHLLQAMRWVAMWRVGGNAQQQALEEVEKFDSTNSSNLILVCACARILSAAKESIAAESAIERAIALVTKDTKSADRLLLADLLLATQKLELAAKNYELIATQNQHSELHNRLLYCYVRTGALRKAKELLFSFPDSWTANERALELAIDLGQAASDWEFLVPLAELFCNRNPNGAGGWLLRLMLDVKMRRMTRFHHTLESVPPDLVGSPRVIAQIAQLEIRYGRKIAGVRRLYSMFRKNLDSADAASAYFIAIVGGAADLPFMEDSLAVVKPGVAISLRGEFGELKTLSIDPESSDVFPSRADFLSIGSDVAVRLQGASVGQNIDLPGPFSTLRNYVVERVQSVFRYLLHLAQERVTAPDVADTAIMAVPVPKTADGADFTHVHAMLKKQSEHSRLALQVYRDNPITLGILSRLLGKSVVDVVLGWPADAPELFVFAGGQAQREIAADLLSKNKSEYVVDAATVAELAALDCLSVLSVLPRVYISTKSMEALEARFEVVKLGRSSGQLFDDNGTMRYVESTAKDYERHRNLFQSMVDAVHKYCEILPAYGPVSIPAGFEDSQKILEPEEYSAVLLAVEKGAVLFTIDGRLAQFASMHTGLKHVWPQEVLRYAAIRKTLEHRQFSFAVVRQFLRRRSFVSLQAYDLAILCLQGGYAIQEGLLRVKEYVASQSTDLQSAQFVVFEFLKLQTRYPTQLKAFAELFSHLVEAVLRHPQCDIEHTILLFRELAMEIAYSSNDFDIPYPAVIDVQQMHIEVYMEVLTKAIELAVQSATNPLRHRPINLQLLKCSRIPYLTYHQNGVGIPA